MAFHHLTTLIRAKRFENKQHSFKKPISPHQTGHESWWGGGFPAQRLSSEHLETELSFKGSEKLP